jgi:hypothetical protein
MTTDVESRLRAASQSLHRSAAAVPTGAPPSPRSRVPLIAAAVVALVLVVGAALALARDDSDAGVDVSTDPPTSDLTPDGDYRSLLGWDYPDGTWEVYTEKGRLCGQTIERFVGSSVCDDDMERRAIVLYDNRGEPVVLFGVLPDAAVEVEAGIARAEEGLVGWVMTPEQDVEPRVYAIPIHGQPEPTEVTFLDDDGNVIATEPVA